MKQLSPHSKRRGRVASLRPLVLALCGAGFASVVMADLPVKPIDPGTLPDTGHTVNIRELSRTGPNAVNPKVVYEQTEARGLLQSDKQFVGRDATVQFNVPDARSITYWMGTGPNPAYVYGNVSTIGRLVMINPNGIYIGKDATVSAANVLLSALDVSREYRDNDYQKLLNVDEPHVVFNARGYGEEVFSYGSPVVEIADGAKVTATAADGGSVLVIGDRGVRNQGAIQVGKGGAVTLLGAGSAEVDVGDSGYIKMVSAVRRDAQDTVGRTVLNVGTIDAPNGTVTLKTVGTGFGNVFGNPSGLSNSIPQGNLAGVINTGKITAQGSNGGKGTIVMEAEGDGAMAANSGKLDVSAMDAQSTAGGIRMSASRVIVGGLAQLLAEGPTGGGDITLNNLSFMAGEGNSTSQIEVQSSARLSVNATDKGDGGQIKLSTMDGLTTEQLESGSNIGQLRVLGTLDAQGGVNGGNGGTVQTLGTVVSVRDGEQHATINVGARAAGGVGGLWSLYSPKITIGSLLPGGESSLGTSETYINADDISAVLNSGASVGMSTAYQNSQVPTGDLVVERGTAITQSQGGGGNQLFLQSGNDVIVGGDTTISSTSGSLKVALVADANANGQGSLRLQGGGVRQVEQASGRRQALAVDVENAPITINTNGGRVDLVGAQAVPAAGAALPVNSNAGVFINNTTINTQASNGTRGDVSIIGAGGATAVDTQGVTRGVQNGVTIANSDITANNVNIVGNSQSAAGVSLNNTTITTKTGVIDIRGVAQGGTAAPAAGQPIGVDIGQNVVLNAGQGHVRILGRGVREVAAQAGTLDPAFGVRINDLTVTTSGVNPGQQITIVGQSVGSTGAGIEASSSTTAPSLKIHDENGATLASSADLIIGASADATAPRAMNLGSAAALNTTGRRNFRPAGVDASGQVTEAPAQAIYVGNGTSPVATNFIVQPGWFNQGAGTVIGSDIHTGQIVVQDGALEGAKSVTLQNQGEGAGGISLGAQSGDGVQTLSLVTQGPVTQSGPLKVDTLNLVLSPQAAVQLTNAGNQIVHLNYDNAVAKPEVRAQATPSSSSNSGILGYSSGEANFQALSVRYNNETAPVVPPNKTSFEGPDFITEMRTDVYLRGQMGRAQLCTPANTAGAQAMAPSEAEPLALEWSKVRRGAQLTSCSGVQADSSCSAF